MKNRVLQLPAIPQSDYRQARGRIATFQNEHFSGTAIFVMQFNGAVISLTIDNTLFHKIERGRS